MLEFFRKYQRYFFIVIAVVIVISFSFFGTHSAINAPQKAEDRCIGQGVDGSKIMKSELDHMVRFLSSDRNDLALTEKGMMPNFFNDGVVRKDLLGTGIGVLLANAYFENLKGDLNERMTHYKAFRPYRHPTAPFISVENLWSQVLPSQKAHLDAFLNTKGEMNPDAFGLLVNLYLGESAFPPNILREYLMFQQRHYNWIEPDPALERVNLNVFHCRSLEEWFGPQFIELAAQFVINAELIAKERGYKVSFEEARVDLIRNGYESMQTQLRKAEVSEEEISQLWQQQLYTLGMNEKEAVGVWQKIMLFRRLFEDVGGAVFVDPHVYETFYSFASKTAEVDLYHLPDALDIKDFSTLMKLELYLDQVSQNRKEALMLPQTFASISEIEKNCPELIEQRFLVEVSEVKKDEVALGVSLKEMWEWQLEKENFALLTKEFPQLDLKNAEDAEGYFAALEGLGPELRGKIDHFSRGRIVESHPEWIQEALNQKHTNVRAVSFSPNGKNSPFEGVESSEKLSNLFSIAVLKGELDSDPEALAAKNQLELFTGDGETYYRFQVVDRDLTRMVLTFEEASERGILDTLLQMHLEASYPKVRTKNPAVFKTEENEWKPLSEVEKEVGRILFADTLKKIDFQMSQLGIELPEDRFAKLDEFYPKYRLFPHMMVAEKDIRRVGEGSQFLKQAEPLKEAGKLGVKEELSSQWSLVKENTMFKNHERSPWFSSELFSMVEKSWSDVEHRSENRLSFFQLQEKSVPSGNFNAEMKQGQAILSKEAERHLMTSLIERIQKKNAIKLSDVSSERP
ncbi:MAG: hypothetical protein KFB95_02725 [Simkaniaceae bacterium]|nr:MAG: hypothetical protein KFB95_02725 [Simkaniaceae bacterium]